MQILARTLAAAMLLTGGAIHLDLWRGGYRGIPYVGALFLANVVASALLAALVLVRGDRIFLLAGAGLAAGSVGGLVLSRTVGLLGFMESRWTDDALAAMAAEVAVVVAVTLVAALGRGMGPAGRPALVPARAWSRAGAGTRR